METRAKVIEKNGKLQLQCPDGHDLVLRNGKYGQFYGCSEFRNGCRKSIGYKEAQELIEKYHNPQKPTKFEASKYQAEIFKWTQFWANDNGLGPNEVATNTSRHLVVKADAGSGKTTTTIEAMKLLPKGLDILFSCFNKSIANELARRAPTHARVGTLHSVGFSAVKKALPHNPEVDDGKVWNIAKELFPEPKDKPLHNPLRKLVSLVKATLTDPTDEVEVKRIAVRYGVELNGDEDKIVKAIPQAIRMCRERTYVIDYDDMIWLPVVMNLPLGHYDWVFVDEAQDLIACQIELVMRLANTTGHIVAVGDEKQSIYGFRGADVDAIPNIIKALDADVLPLGMSYRNAKAILEHVKEELPHVTTEAAPWAEEGVVRDTRYDKMMLEAHDGDLILCRVNAPLVTACYSFIRRGIKAVIRGRDIGKSLLSFIDKLEPTDVHDLILKIRDYKWEQMAKLEAEGKEDRIQALQDRCDTLTALCEGARDLMELRLNIGKIFNDVQRQGIILSSVHRAKGDEAERVYILAPELMPHPLAQAEWQQAQEMNIKYVALTRAKKELVYVYE